MRAPIRLNFTTILLCSVLAAAQEQMTCPNWRVPFRFSWSPLPRNDEATLSLDFVVFANAPLEEAEYIFIGDEHQSLWIKDRLAHYVPLLIDRQHDIVLL